MLLVGLLLLAASSSFASHATVPQRNRRLRSSSLGEKAPMAPGLVADPSDDDHFHKRNSHIPDVAGQRFETTVKCTKEREMLAEELDMLIAESEELEKKCDTEIKHYRNMNSDTQQQIERLRSMVAEKTDESDLPPFYRTQYTALMCAKFHDGLVMRDRRARQDVYQICDGNKSISDFSHGDSMEPGIFNTPMARYFKNDVAMVAIDPCYEEESMCLQQRETSKSTSNTDASPECFQATTIQEQVDTTKKSRDNKMKKCKMQKAKLKADLKRKKRHEDTLWTRYHGHISNRTTIKADQAKKVSTEFCPAVSNYRNGGSRCSKDVHREAEDFYRKKCLP